MEEILTLFEQRFEGSVTQADNDWLKEKLTAFEKTTKEEFLKKILPEDLSSEKSIAGVTSEMSFGFNMCKTKIIKNAGYDGVTLIK